MRAAILLSNLLFGTLLITANSFASGMPQKAFQAVYEETGPGGKSVRTYSCDGHGHGKSEVLRPTGRRDIVIIDEPSKKITMLMGDSPTPTTIPLGDNDLSAIAAFGQEVKAGGKPLGTKVIDGHPCHGFHYVIGGMQEDLWTGDDIGMRVYSKVDAGFGTVEAHLRSYSPVAPAASAFKLN
jgi:hypothetical protein